MAKILIVDDQALIRELLTDLLRLNGHDAIEASEGSEALAIVRAERPGLIITDVLMPNIDGYEFVRQLRSDPVAGRTPVIFHTATYDEREAHALAEAGGVVQTLCKPIHPEALLETVKAALNSVQGPSAQLGQAFDREHVRLLTDKLHQKVEELEIANLQLRVSEEQYRLLFEHNPLPMWVFDDEGRNFIAVNDAAVAHYGYSREEFLRLTIQDIQPPEDMAAVGGHPSLQKGNGIQEAGTWRHRKRDGTRILVEVVTSPIIFRNRPARLVLAKDVTVQRRITEQVRESARQLHELTGRLNNIREEERTRISRELHDQLGQSLTAIRMEIAWALDRLPLGEPDLTQKMRSAIRMVDATVNIVRRLATELRPAVLDLGLIAAIEWQAEEFEERTGTECQLALPPHDVVLDQDKLIAVFRILQEALTNVARHSKATQARIVLTEQPRDLVLEVHDNGRGMDADYARRGSLGLLGMRERAVFVGGELTLTSAPGQGTVVTARIPLLPVATAAAAN
jgi:two-component system sensor histidine kinase UhpB